MRSFFHTRRGEYSAIWCNWCSLSDIYPIELAKRIGIPIRIAHSHNSMNMSGLITGSLHAYNRSIIMRYATHYFGCSKVACKWLFPKKVIELGLCKVINNAVDISQLRYDARLRKEARKVLSLDGMFVVGHIGRFHRQKNHKFLIDIFFNICKSIHDAKLILVGNGESLETIKHYVKDLGISDKVLFLGQRDDIPRLLQAMDVFVLPSLFEGLPVVAIEAQASGLPCVLSKNITNDVVLSDSCIRLSLEDGPAVWANNIIRYKGFPRVDESNLIIDSNYEIVAEAKKMESFLLGEGDIRI